jgi:Zn-dependent protease
MFSSWRIGKAFGIDVYIHWTFWLLIPFLYYQWRADATFAFTGIAVLLATFGCIVLHELGHALMARYYRIGTEDITVYPLGGVARLKGMSEVPSEEIAIALAGPAVNVVIAALLTALLWLGGGIQMGAFGHTLDVGLQSREPGTLSAASLFVHWLLLTNVALVVFNLLPVFPMDGGRVFRAVLNLFVDRVTATTTAVAVGSVFAIGFVLLGLAGNPMLALVGIMVLFVGIQELTATRMIEQQRAHAAGWVEVVPPILQQVEVRLHPSARPADADFSGYTWDRRAGAWIQWRNGQPIAVAPVNMR